MPDLNHYFQHLQNSDGGGVKSSGGVGGAKIAFLLRK